MPFTHCLQHQLQQQNAYYTKTDMLKCLQMAPYQFKTYYPNPKQKPYLHKSGV